MKTVTQGEGSAGRPTLARSISLASRAGVTTTSGVRFGHQLLHFE